MSQTNLNTTEKAPLWMGLLFLIVPTIIFFLNPEPSPGTPYWVLYAALSVFFIAGLCLLFPKTSAIFGPLIVIIFAIIATWIGFSPDAKGCSSSFSIPFFSRERSTGCGVFAVPAVILWIFVLWIFYASISKLIKR